MTRKCQVKSTSCSSTIVSAPCHTSSSVCCSLSMCCLAAGGCGVLIGACDLLNEGSYRSDPQRRDPKGGVLKGGSARRRRRIFCCRDSFRSHGSRCSRNAKRHVLLFSAIILSSVSMSRVTPVRFIQNQRVEPKETSPAVVSFSIPRIPPVQSIQFNPIQSTAVNIEEPDARTAALARGQEYLYGFKPSDLPQELLDQVEAAGEETRKLAYVRWACGCACRRVCLSMVMHG